MRSKYFFLQQARYFWFAVLLLFFVEPNQILSRINNLTIQTRTTALSKQVLVPKRGKKKCDHFFLFVNHLNQRKPPSTTLASQEIESEHRFVFFQKSRYSRELAVKSFLFDALHSIRRTTRFAYRLSLARKLKTFLS